MNTSLERIYKMHHALHREDGFTLLEKERGKLFATAIGTGKKVLDIGCRDGALTKYFTKGNDVLGVDIDTVALARAAETLGIKITQADLNGDWHFPKNHFDAVIAAEVIEHLYYPEEAVKKIAGVLKPEGVLVGSVPNAFSLKNRVRLFCGKKKNTPLADPTHINHFSQKEIAALLQRHFHEVIIHPLGRYAFLDKAMPGMFSFMTAFEARRKR